MKKHVILFSYLVGITIATHAQILPVRVCIQEQNQWCWAGVSQCVLDYYDMEVTQCDIADYVRTVSTWHDFGSIHCCTNPGGACNYWNYNWGVEGSIQDILSHFVQLDNSGVTPYLSKEEVTEQLSSNRPFIIRWGWTYGGGHFVVGHGLDGETLYYMDPWPGEGAKMATHAWVVNDGTHSWTHTNIMLRSSTTHIDEATGTANQARILANPSETGSFTIENLPESGASYALYSSHGQLIRQGNISDSKFSVSVEGRGVFILRITKDNGVETHKLIAN